MMEIKICLCRLLGSGRINHESDRGILMLSSGEIGGTEYQMRKSRWSARSDYTAWLLLGASIIESGPCSVGLHLVEASRMQS
jgi:hypothetical protein